MTPAILTEAHAEKIFRSLKLPERFSDLKIPFCAVATDIGRADEKDFWSGDLVKAVAASSSIAGIFPPVEINGNFYLDGATVNSVPVSPLKQCCDLVIACDVRPERRTIPPFRRGLDILARTDAISSYKLSDIQIEQADFIIKPDVSGIHWANFKRASESIAKGAEAAEAAANELRKHILKEKLSGLPRRLFGGKRIPPQ